MMIALEFFVILAATIGNVRSESDFTYYGTLGPDHWSEHFNQCAGKHQSPININDVDVIDREFYEIECKECDKKPSAITMTNNGHTVLVKLTYNGQVPYIEDGPVYGKGKYEFQQLHFHWGEDNTVGSEDRINNVSYPMELHVVFRNAKYSDFLAAARKDDGVAVMAFFYEISENSEPNYDTFSNKLQYIHEPETTTKAESLLLNDLIPTNLKDYYTYIGSLTTPPCSEDVIWMDFTTPIKIAPNVMERFRALKTFDGQPLHHNFRPVQPLNNRKVFRAKKNKRQKDGDILFVNGRNGCGAKDISFAIKLMVSLASALLTLNIYLV